MDTPHTIDYKPDVVSILATIRQNQKEAGKPQEPPEIHQDTSTTETISIESSPSMSRRVLYLVHAARDKLKHVPGLRNTLRRIKGLEPVPTPPIPQTPGSVMAGRIRKLAQIANSNAKGRANP